MDELNATMNDPARPWHRKALDAIKIIPQVGGAFLAGGPTAALTKAITATAAQFFVEVAAKGGSAETQRLDVPSSASSGVGRQPILEQRARQFLKDALAGRRQWRLFRKGRRPSRNYRPIKVEDYSGAGRPGC